MRPWALYVLAWLAPACGLRLLGGLSRAARFFGARRPIRVVNAPGALELPVGSAVKVLVWNVQYGAGIDQHFFYDGGPAVSSTRETVLRTTEAICDVICRLQPDVVLLQEVDRRSRRTGKVDEFSILAARLEKEGLGCRCSAAYWRVPYVPHPKQEHVGRIGMHLATFSRYKIEKAVRHQLPLLAESRVRRIFNLRRAVLEARLVGGATFLNTHLSAFSYADGTLERQVKMLDERILPAAGSKWFLAGDFNSLTPFQKPSELKEAEERALYTDSSPVAPLYARHKAAFSETDFRQPEPPYTYKAFTSKRADRTIDHAFVSPAATVLSKQVHEPQTDYLSDHQPLEVIVRFD
mmetsp:Transcript_29406/g.101674  ORF Transcript_29406/g.101674 Transcript_29406/m.101674 type:complete len:351 (-) Transcript_29406:811-1863(-)